MIKSVTNGYRKLVSFGEALQPWLLLAMRLYWGTLFFLAGYGKLQDFGKVTQFFASLHIPFSDGTAHAVAWVEMVGGISLILGVASRLCSIPLIIVMVAAYATAHRSDVLQLFSNPSAVISAAPFNFLLTALIVLAFGPGRWSIDHLFARRYCGK